MMSSGTAVRRVLLAATAVAFLWAIFLKATGGFAIETPWRLISSRNVIRPLLAGLGMLAWYLVVWRRHWRTDLGPLVHVGSPHGIAALAAAAALVAGVGWGSRMGAGPDPSGYVSQAAMLARGELTQAAPAWAQNAAWDDAAYTASPVGWHPSPQTHIIVPMYSVGLPLILAAVSLVAGSEAMYFVVPVLGAVLVGATYLLAAEVAGAWAGAIAAVLLLSSPTFLSLSLQMMSDVPVAAFWTVSFASALRGTHPAVSGTAAALAILTRPNLVPLTLVPLLVVAWKDRRFPRLIAFSLPAAAGCGVVAALNWTYQGSPLVSGYGALGSLFSTQNIAPNLAQYSRWMADLHTPLVFLGFAAPFVAKANRLGVVLVTVVVPAALLASYMPYAVFGYSDWGYTRFLLPAFPGLLAGLGLIGVRLAGIRPRPAWTLAAVAIVVVMSVHGWTYAVRAGVFNQRSSEARFAWAVEYARQLPARSIVLSNAHSGTLRFYGAKDVLRFETIPREEIDTVTASLRAQGFELFFIGDEFEIEEFRERFEGTRTLAALSPEPRAAARGVVVYGIARLDAAEPTTSTARD